MIYEDLVLPHAFRRRGEFSADDILADLRAALLDPSVLGPIGVPSIKRFLEKQAKREDAYIIKLGPNRYRAVKTPKAEGILDDIEARRRQQVAMINNILLMHGMLPR